MATKATAHSWRLKSEPIPGLIDADQCGIRAVQSDFYRASLSPSPGEERIFVTH